LLSQFCAGSCGESVAGRSAGFIACSKTDFTVLAGEGCSSAGKGFSVEGKGFSVEEKGFSVEEKGFSVEEKGFSVEEKDLWVAPSSQPRRRVLFLHACYVNNFIFLIHPEVLSTRQQ